MAGSPLRNGISASPNSSEEVESQHGTPSTKLSPFSPETNFHEPLKSGIYGISRSRVPPSFNLARGNSNFGANGRSSDSTTLAARDPFVSAPNLTATTQASPEISNLSPVAADFTPATSIGLASSHGLLASGSKSYDGPSALALRIPLSALQARYGGSNGKTSDISAASGTALVSPTIQPISFKNATVFKVGRPRPGSFSSDDGSSRTVVVSQVTQKVSADEVRGFFVASFDPAKAWTLVDKSQEFLSLKDIELAELPSTGTVHIKFDDIRDADRAYVKVQQAGPGWSVQYLSVLNGQPKGLHYSPMSVCEGQLIVTANLLGKKEQFDVESIGALVKGLLGNCGEVMGFELTLVNGLQATFRTEFFLASAVNTAVEKFRGFQISGCTFSISTSKSDAESSTQRPLNVPGPLILGREDSLESNFSSMTLGAHHNTYGPQTPRTTAFSPYPVSSPASRRLTGCNNVSVQQTPSSLGRFTHGFPSGMSEQSAYWSPSYTPYPDIGVQSPLYSPLSPGAIGQERGAMTFPEYRQESYNKRQGGQTKTEGRQRRENGSGHHNFVDVERIRRGIDVRTTIMLRNIPNRVGYEMLKEIVDRCSFGKYDFMYLRIDFANNCNVGYAFINFEDPFYIIGFMECIAGKRWNRYNSDKIAEVSYATIQGRDCLIQKFRNSSVMLEHPDHRPKLFYTYPHPKAGQEEPFPGSDNQTKMLRSVQNAEHIGLFAPRAGQNLRDEQRRRRSQFDRGTRFAEIEDSYEGSPYDSHIAANAFHSLGQAGTYQEPYYPRAAGPPF